MISVLICTFNSWRVLPACGRGNSKPAAHKHNVHSSTEAAQHQLHISAVEYVDFHNR
jgi:hypothetical protein